MVRKISFPGLGIKELTLNSVAFEIFGLEIAWYALIITLGMILAVLYTMYRAKAVGIDYEQIIDFAIFVVPIGILGARLYYVLCELDQYDTFWEVFNIRQGGLAIYGGIIAGALTVFAVCKYKKIPFPAFGDCIVPGLILAQAIGRWGNFMNVEAFGSVTAAPWRMCGTSIAAYLSNQITSEEIRGILDGSLGVHPTFFYESFWNIIGFVAINFFYKHKRYDGQIILLVFGWYGLGRAWIEGLRTDSLYIPGTPIRVSQLLAIIIFAACLGLLIYFAVKPPKKPLYHKEPAVAEGRVPNKTKKKAPVAIESERCTAPEVVTPDDSKEPAESGAETKSEDIPEDNTETTES